MDRIDLHVNVPTVEYSELQSELPTESSADMLARVSKAQSIQKKRFNGTNIIFNSRMPEKVMSEKLLMERETKNMLENVMEKLTVSARSYGKILRVSRTIADLDLSDTVKVKHLAEALQYRMF
jgi:magnesium chelatase family protein